MSVAVGIKHIWISGIAYSFFFISLLMQIIHDIILCVCQNVHAADDYCGVKVTKSSCTLLVKEIQLYIGYGRNFDDISLQIFCRVYQ